MKIALSDVDGTIVRSSLVLSHAVALSNEGVINVGSLAKDWQKDMKNETIISALAEAYRDEIMGRTASDIASAEYVAEMISDKRNFYASVIERLVSMRSEGDDVILISGSPGYLIEPFAEHFNFQGVGSDYKVNATGHFTGEVDGMFHGDAKRNYVAGLDLARYTEVHAYGDTRSDVPLFEKASYSVLVAPNNDTRSSLSGVVHEIIEH